MRELFLTPEEIATLTGRVRRQAQSAALKHMGIIHKVRPDGGIVVLKDHVDKVLGGNAEKVKTVKRVEPNWGGVC